MLNPQLQIMRQHTYIVLHQTSHPGNIGAAARALKTMGLRNLRLVAPKQFPHADATARASGADDVLAACQVFADLPSALADCHYVYASSARNRHLDWQQASPALAAANIMQQLHAISKPEEQSSAHAVPNIAIVFGPEQSGLSNQDLAYCQMHIVIPTDANYGSLNLAAAIQVIAYALRIAALDWQPAAAMQVARLEDVCATSTAALERDDRPATSAQLEGLLQQLETQMQVSGFLDRRQPRLLMQRIRRFFQRRTVSEKEINIWRGFLTSVQRYLPKTDQES